MVWHLTGYPWVGKIPWRRKWEPTPVFLPEKSYGQRRLVATKSMGSQRVGQTEHACTHSKPLLHLVNKLPLNKCYPTIFELLNKPHMRAQLPEGSLAGPACSMTSVLINIPSMPTYKEGKSSLKGIQVCLQRGGVGWTNKYNAADQ